MLLFTFKKFWREIKPSVVEKEVGFQGPGEYSAKKAATSLQAQGGVGREEPVDVTQIKCFLMTQHSGCVFLLLIDGWIYK